MTTTQLQRDTAWTMKQGFSVAMLVVGIVLLIWGVSAMDSFSSDVSKFFTGSPTDKSVWLMIGGAVAAIIGLFGLSSFYRTRRTHRID